MCNFPYALVNFMPHPLGGWGKTGNLTNRVIKCPTTGAKSAVKSPLCPQALAGGLTAHLVKYCTVATSNSSECDSMPLPQKLEKFNLNVNYPRGGDKC